MLFLWSEDTKRMRRERSYPTYLPFVYSDWSANSQHPFRKSNMESPSTQIHSFYPPAKKRNKIIILKINLLSCSGGLECPLAVRWEYCRSGEAKANMAPDPQCLAQTNSPPWPPFSPPTTTTTTTTSSKQTLLPIGMSPPISKRGVSTSNHDKLKCSCYEFCVQRVKINLPVWEIIL